MPVVLVTGGTGTLGRAVVPRLVAAGHEVRVLSRREHPPVPTGVAAFRGDVRTGAGVEAAVQGADVLVHAASDPRGKARETEVEGTRQVAAAAAAAEAHLSYVSIVGVDRHRFPYYRAKRAAELLVADSGAPWTVLRATQFHDLLHAVLSSPLFIRTPNLRFQPVEVTEVADRLVDLAGGAPLGLAPDFGGPDVLDIRRLAESHRVATGRRTRLVRIPALGFVADFDAGVHLTPQHRAGTRTWLDWLAERGRPAALG